MCDREAKSRDPVPRPPSGLRVLICGTDKRFEQQAKKILKASGWNAAHAETVSDAIEMIDLWQPDVIVVPSDIIADDSDTNVLGQRIRELAHGVGVVITAQMDQFDDAWKAWHKGVHDSVFKPLLSHEELLAAIAHAYAMARDAQTNEVQDDRDNENTEPASA